MNSSLPLKRLLLLIIFLTGIYFSSFAQSIKGKVFDNKTGEPLTGATIKIERGDFKRSASAGLNGSYSFNNLQAGTYKLEVNFVGYRESKNYEVVVRNNTTVVTQDILLQDLSAQLNEVVVTGQGSKVSDRAVRGVEKNANSVVNILSQNTIQLLPDVTVGNALQRVSGVTIQRSTSGEGRYAIIRGMDQRYNTVLVNGIKIPSPDDQYRFVPLDIFPSELLERLEVIKTLTPTMEGDAIGGTLNLVMKNAPNRLILNANAAAGYSFLFSGKRPFSSFNESYINKQSPAEINGNTYQATAKDFQVNSLNYTPKSNPINKTFGLTIGDRFLNHKLGVVFSGSYQDFFRGSNSVFLVPNAEPVSFPIPNTPSIAFIYNRQYSTETNRIGLHNKIDYVFNSKNKISLYNLYVHQNEYQTRFTADSDLITTTSKAGITYRTLNRSTWTYQSVYNATLQGEHQLTDKLNFNWSGAYSIAKKNTPDQAEYQIDHTANLDGHGNTISADSIAHSITHVWQHNTDKDLAGYYNFTYTPKIAQKDIEISVGGLYRHKTRDNYYASYSLDANPTNQAYHNNINDIQFAFSNAGKGTGLAASSIEGNDYIFHENVAGEYLQAKFMLLNKLQIIGGVRVENTAQDYATTQPATIPAQHGSIKYIDVLPSVNLKYLLTADQNLRLAYYKSISRPGFNELAPTQQVGDTYNQVGNPNLQHIRADNYDFRYELFPGGADQVLLGAFYKDIKNPIEFVNVNGVGAQPPFQTGAPSVQYLQPQNTGSATNYGAEAQLTKFFGIFGVSANYTYTHSSITTQKLSKNNAAQVVYVNETRPLQGQAENIGNFSFLFKSAKIGLDIQLAYVYTGERINQVSNYAGLDIWQKPYNQIDFSFEKILIKKLSVYGKLNNLTNASNVLFLKHSSTAGQVAALPAQESPNYLLIQKDIYKVSFLGGLRYKL
jgi:outer membrane receptor protein involved in Fe transport